MIDGLEMVAERFATHGNAVLDDFRRFAQREGVPLDGVRRVGEINIVVLLELRQGSRRQRAQAVELRLLLFNLADKSLKHGFSVAYN